MYFPFFVKCGLMHKIKKDFLRLTEDSFSSKVLTVKKVYSDKSRLNSPAL